MPLPKLPAGLLFVPMTPGTNELPPASFVVPLTPKPPPPLAPRTPAPVALELWPATPVGAWPCTPVLPPIPVKPTPVASLATIAVAPVDFTASALAPAVPFWMVVVDDSVLTLPSMTGMPSAARARPGLASMSAAIVAAPAAVPTRSARLDVRVDTLLSNGPAMLPSIHIRLPPAHDRTPS